MGYIIVWNRHFTEPHIDLCYENFINDFEIYEDAKKEADKIIEIEHQGIRNPDYINYSIYKEVNE